jgi:hypothetical protein
VFAEQPKDKKQQFLSKLEEIKKNASPQVKSLISIANKEPENKPIPEVELIVKSLVDRIDISKTIFTKPLASTYFAAIKKTNKQSFLDYWAYKMKAIYQIECLDPRDPTLTDERENEIIKSQLNRHK